MGIVVGVFTLTALVTALVVPLRAARARVVVRVARSWIAAVGLLLLGWALRRGLRTEDDLRQTVDDDQGSRSIPVGGGEPLSAVGAGRLLDSPKS
jgi:hypothetical protein